MTDLTKTVAPKTDQLNADDLFAGKTLTLTITGVKATNAKEQPIAISYDGDKGKPWKPSLGMRRVLIELWGEDAAKEADKYYTGRSVTLYRDPNVKFGNDVVGGIRISHASDIKAEKKVALTVSKARRVEFVVKPLATTAKSAVVQNQAATTETTQSNPEHQFAARKVHTAIKAEASAEMIDEIFTGSYKTEMDYLKSEKSNLFQWLIDEGEKKKNMLRENSGMGG